jgi:hypothetical protein
MDCTDGFCPLPVNGPAPDEVNHPAHYTAGRRFEVIDVLEDAVTSAPDPVLGGLQWQTLKYLNRLWGKGDPLKDAKKARWYLERLINKLESMQPGAAATAIRLVPARQASGSEPAELFAKIPEPGVERR